jgi:hypothetical protein
MKENINDIVGSQITKLQTYLKAIKDNALEIKTIDIDSSYLTENYRGSQTFSKSENFKDLYDGLVKDKPVLYWFTLDADKFSNDSTQLNIQEIKESTKGRKMAYLPEKYRDSSGTLYVGKVKDKFHYRFVNHLGHSVNEKTGSLQLTYWYDTELYGNLKLNYIVLDKEMDILLGVLEIELAKKLMPLIGSHKN